MRGKVDIIQSIFQILDDGLHDSDHDEVMNASMIPAFKMGK